MQQQQQRRSIDETFAGKSFLITGGSGFLGRVLVEKLLRSCPHIDTIYLLMRKKRGVGVEARLEEIRTLPLFDKLNASHPDMFHRKVVAIEGDVSELNLGISDRDLAVLKERVNVFHHVAATVKFNQPLGEAITLNVRGTREACNLALQLPNIEEMYAPPADWRRCIDIAEKIESQHELQVMMGRFIEGHVNTYTFTKALAEHVVRDTLDGHIPHLIIRPSVVIGSAWDPFPGWIDNFNGPYALYVLGGCGLVYCCYMKRDHIIDYIPVDVCIRIHIVALWNKLCERNNDVAKTSTTIYHSSLYDFHQRTQQYHMATYTRLARAEFPFANVIWYPNQIATDSYTFFWLCTMLLQVVPQLFYDFILWLRTGRTRLIRLQVKVFVALHALAHFNLNAWRFVNKNAFALNDKLMECDCDAFGYEAERIDEERAIVDCMIGVKKFLLRERLDIPKTRITILKYLHWFVTVAFYFVLIKVVCGLIMLLIEI